VNQYMKKYQAHAVVFDKSKGRWEFNSAVHKAVVVRKQRNPRRAGCAGWLANYVNILLGPGYRRAVGPTS
jgi:hypothetical protein